MYYLVPLKNSEVFDRGIEGLIKAGYKADPSNYYKLKKENKLTGQEIRELIFGKKIEGTYFYIPWSLATMGLENEGQGQEKPVLLFLLICIECRLFVFIICLMLIWRE